jgi:hypothetical protein
MVGINRRHKNHARRRTIGKAEEIPLSWDIVSRRYTAPGSASMTGQSFVKEKEEVDRLMVKNQERG